MIGPNPPDSGTAVVAPIFRRARHGFASSARGVEGPRGYALFQNAGFRGMYNTNLGALTMRKGVPAGRRLLDFMGKDELAANLFRLSLTEQKIQNEDIHGQKPLERAAEAVGQRVRRTIIDETGTAPERLPIASDIKAVRNNVRITQRGFRKLDTPRKRSLPAPRS